MELNNQKIVIRFNEETQKFSIEPINPNDRLNYEKLKEKDLKSIDLYDYIIQSGEAEAYLAPEMIKELQLSSYDIENIIERIGKIDEYLDMEKIKEIGIQKLEVKCLLCKASNNKIIEWLSNLEKVKFLKPSPNTIIELTNRISSCVNREKLEEIITTINENIDFEETLEDVLEMEESFDALFSDDDNENN